MHSPHSFSGNYFFQLKPLCTKPWLDSALNTFRSLVLFSCWNMVDLLKMFKLAVVPQQRRNGRPLYID